MRALLITALIVLGSLAGLTYAQAAAQRGQTDITQPTPITMEGLPEMHPTICFLPDDSGHPLNTGIT